MIETEPAPPVTSARGRGRGHKIDMKKTPLSPGTLPVTEQTGCAGGCICGNIPR